MRLYDKYIRAQDFEEIFKISNASFGDIERAPRPVLRDAFERADVFVEFSRNSSFTPDGEICAYAFLTTKYDEPYVWVIATDERYRGQGLAGKLLEEMADELRSQAKWPSMWLTCHVKNATAQRVYLAHGFKVDKVLDDYYGPNEDGLAMRRVL
jgi:ribosomal protein S18 acetylase RimI-like enzyme